MMEMGEWSGTKRRKTGALVWAGRAGEQCKGLYYKRNFDFAYLMWEDFVYHVEHKDTKKSNEMYYPRFTKVIIHHFMSKDPSIPSRNKVNWNYVRDDHMFSTIKLVSRHQNTQQFGALLPIELTNEDIRNSNAYKEYYPVATGATPPKPKASVRKTKSSSDTTITPPTVVAGPRLTTFKKGKQAAKASKAKSLYALSEVAMREAQQMKLATKRSLQQTYISQASGSGVDEGTGYDDEGKNGDSDDDDDDGDDGEEGDGDDDDEDDDGEEGNYDDDDQEMNESVKVAVQLQSDRLREEAYTENDEFLKTIDENMQKIIKEQVKEQVKVQVFKILPKIEQTVNEQLEADVLTRSSNSSKTSYAIAADLSEMELKKILIKKMEGNKSIQRSNEQRNLYKALFEAYEFHKIILDTYGDIVTLKRRRDDDADKDKEPSAGSDRGSKRRREGKEPKSASAPKEKATRSAGKSTHRIIAVTELKIAEWHNYKHLDWITVRRDDDKLYKFNEGDFKRLRIQDIEDMLLLLIQGKLTNLIVEERFAFNVSLRMFIRSIVIQRRVEDLQLGVIGAPPEVVERLEEACRASVVAAMSSREGGGGVASSDGGMMMIGQDPALDQFMEAYCEMLIKYEQELSKPFKEAMLFLSRVESQFKAISISTSDSGI
nr:homeobox protein knotted-1-like LET6 isoform X1 [Tanacetum cinerariifolium]